MFFFLLFTTLSCSLVFLPNKDVNADTGPFSFTNFELGGAGTTCPNSLHNCTNTAAEPQMRAAPNGYFYTSSENGLGAGTSAWKSTDGGLHYLGLNSPNSVSSCIPLFGACKSLGPSGGDTDLAVATQKNTLGKYNVYVESLNLANVAVSTSADEGATWSLNPAVATISADDRPWIAADGSSKLCVSYHAALGADITVQCSYDSGKTFPQISNALDQNHLWLASNTQIGNIAINPNNHVIYQTFVGLGSQSETLCIIACSNGFHAVWMAVSTDNGLSFTDYPVYVNPNTTVSYDHQFPSVAVDTSGNVYVVYSDGHNVYYSFSKDQGKDWSSPVQINSAPSNTAIEPWIAAGSNGGIDVVWYGTSYYDGTGPDNYPQSASWYVFFAQNLQATTTGSSFSQVTATPIVHFGGVCGQGITCTGNRDLFDDFGIAANPTTGMASIVYSDDQFVNSNTSPPSSGCSLSTTNTSSCDHTSIVTQLTGSGILEDASSNTASVTTPLLGTIIPTGPISIPTLP